MRTGFLLLIAGALVGSMASCASNTSQTAKAAQESDPSKGIICTYERPTNSFLREKRCTTPEQREAERRQQELTIDARNERDSGI